MIKLTTFVLRTITSILALTSFIPLGLMAFVMWDEEYLDIWVKAVDRAVGE